MIIRLYKTGDPCPCCGQPIKLTNPEELFKLSLIAAHVLVLTETRPQVEFDDVVEAEI